jgi:hypothetical protein
LSDQRTASISGRLRRAAARVRNGDVLLAIVIGAAIVLLVNFSLAEIFGFLYHPVAGLIALLLIVEYLWLKSGDRTRIYRMEVDRLRQLRRSDEDLLRRCRAALKSGQADDALLTQLDERL